MITTGFTYVAVLLFLAGALVSLEKTSNPILGKLFCYLPAIALCYLLPMVLCSYGAWDLEATQPVYDALASSLTYALVFTMLLRCDLRRIIKLGPTILITFFSASVTICIGFVVAFILMQPYIGSDAWKTLGALCGS